jgi:hypothetical protein
VASLINICVALANHPVRGGGEGGNLKIEILAKFNIGLFCRRRVTGKQDRKETYLQARQKELVRETEDTGLLFRDRAPFWHGS